MNNLKNEKSSYLLQHINNPVDWYPWGDKAFNKAKKEDKPVFLSIGYSTCHWCHVMAHETFEDENVAKILNENFVCIKVDREERPDIDNIYMAACQAFTGSGGWPLSVFLDNNKMPFFAGTYYPKENFKKLIERIISLWKNQREELKNQAEQVVDIIKGGKKDKNYSLIGNTVNKAVKYLYDNFDYNFGGFSYAPKFPTPHNLLFLLDYYLENPDKKILDMCKITLKAMYSGGIYDHIGGGFSRYSTDNKWLVPHFEKMLYDNTLLMIAYSKMFSVTNDKFYSEVSEGIASYLLRDLYDAKKAFYTAEDADSEGHEGLFYIFSQSEIKDVLQNDAEEFCYYFNVTEKGNFEGKNILNTIGRIIPDGRKKFVSQCCNKLFAYRNKRIRPHCDKKMLTSLNGLAIAAFSIAGKLINNNYYIDIAKKTSEFIDKNLSEDENGLVSVFFDTPGIIKGFAEDYAFYIWGLLELFKTTEKAEYLSRAVQLQETFTKEFFDSENGGFFISGKKAEKMIIKTKELYDGAIPSYNSLTLNNLFELYSITKNTEYLEIFIKTLKYFSEDIANYPQGYIYSVSAIMKLQNSLPNIHICSNNVCRPPAKNIDEFTQYFL